MFRFIVDLSNPKPVTVEESKIEGTIRDWYLKQIIDYSDQCMAIARIFLVLSIAGIAAVTFTTNLPSHGNSESLDMWAHLAFALCILFSSATYFPFGLKVSTSTDIRADFKFIVKKDFVVVSIALLCLSVGIGLTFVLYHCS